VEFTWEEIANASEETKKLIREEYGPLGDLFIKMAPSELKPLRNARLTREEWDRVHREVVESYMLRRPDLPYEGEEKKS
jgi:hypothetical protein